MRRVKICGITRTEDAKLALQLGAWALGFVFHRKSPRAVTPEQAGAIIREAGATQAKLVGVFVDAPQAEIEQTVCIAGLTTVQLHGSESPELCRALQTDVIKAARPSNQADIDALARYEGVSALLIDAAPGLTTDSLGGTGRLSNWELARAAKQHGPLILSGGLKAENVRAAVQAVDPWALDLSSGVEETPGRKSPDKLKAFFQEIRTL